MSPIFAVAALLLLTPAAFAQASRDACDMIDKNGLEALLGPAPDIVEQHGAGTGVSFCHWSSGEGAGVRLHSITAMSQNIVGGTPLDYFRQSQDYQIESLTPANAHEIVGPWQAGYMVDVTTEPNPDQVYSITFINKDDTVTVETYGLPSENTMSLAEAVAAGM
ncbi:hypothetical protein [Devosia ginsengisoli]|uniref:hypothetical protein n=1 Tax=Devosia ginsengisoli TaxID=400770 RepID=UPI0026EDFE41|nr:hypothetical protein [Devosia ginsengisoli]MCR6671095.1 hypothetical protein [Devosia ginsengisoli]